MQAYERSLPCGPRGAHNHRAPLNHEIRYFKVRYHARVFCVTNRSVVGLTAFLVGMITLYHLPWSSRDVFDTLAEMATTCARTECIWPRALIWPESQEQVLHDQREASARAKRANRSARRMELLENRLGYAGDDAQAPEPAAGLNEGVPSLENVAAVQLDKGMAENLD